MLFFFCGLFHHTHTHRLEMEGSGFDRRMLWADVYVCVCGWLGWWWLVARSRRSFIFTNTPPERVSEALTDGRCWQCGKLHGVKSKSFRATHHIAAQWARHIIYLHPWARESSTGCAPVCSSVDWTPEECVLLIAAAGIRFWSRHHHVCAHHLHNANRHTTNRQSLSRKWVLDWWLTMKMSTVWPGLPNSSRQRAFLRVTPAQHYLYVKWNQKQHEKYKTCYTIPPAIAGHMIKSNNDTKPGVKPSWVIE